MYFRTSCPSGAADWLWQAGAANLAMLILPWFVCIIGLCVVESDEPPVCIVAAYIGAATVSFATILWVGWWVINRCQQFYVFHLCTRGLLLLSAVLTTGASWFKMLVRRTTVH